MHHTFNRNLLGNKFPGVFFIFLFIFSIHSLFGQELYQENYRPQIHVSPSSGFMGDPNGPLKYEGKYRFYWWGHLDSDDLIYWREITKDALNGTPTGFGEWSGSVVIDKNNTSGLGKSGNVPRVALFTLNNNSNGNQSVAAAVSQNAGSFTYIDSNPVLQTNEKDFRDPSVFWHDATKKWIMVITKSDNRSIRFYSSANLLQWVYMSEFKGRGAQQEVWEVPDLFEIPVNGDNLKKKWILTCGMGPNRMQYWVGDFDGNNFRLDTLDNLVTGRNIEGRIFDDFENDYSNWIVAGSAFGSKPVRSELVDQQFVSGKMGMQYITSYHGKDTSVGQLTSAPFTVSNPFLNVLVGGGSMSSVGIRVLIDQTEVGATRNSRNSEQFLWRSIDLSNYIGKTATIQIYDQATGDWGHVNIDHLVFSDVKMELFSENANWIDFGTDYYAGKSFRNYDNDDKRVIYMAWMGNWTYAQNVPTSPWKGSQSLFREVELLYSINEGYSLVQKPINEYKKLRKVGNEVSKINLLVKNEVTIDDFRIPWNVAEFKVSFAIDKGKGAFGIKLAKGTDQEIVIKYDPFTNILSVDRSKLPYSFSGRQWAYAPIFLNGKKELDLHIFLDQSSIEIFANDYKTRLSLLAFNLPAKNDISLFSENETLVKYLQAWELNSIWNIVKKEEIILSTKKEDEFALYPNPAQDFVICPKIKNNSKVTIIDLTGRIIETRFAESHIDISKLAQGVYHIIVETNTEINTFKFVKL